MKLIQSIGTGRAENFGCPTYVITITTPTSPVTIKTKLTATATQKMFYVVATIVLIQRTNHDSNPATEIKTVSLVEYAPQIRKYL